MLQPNKDRVDYGDMLIPPIGYHLDQAIATTYSLNLDTLLSIPVALYFARSVDIDLKNDIVQVLEAIRKANKTVKIFCQKGQISVPKNQHKLYSFLEDCVVQIPYSKNHSFHPKVWVLRYVNENMHIVYRCIVLTRNLTFDRSWDVAFAIDGEMRKTNNRKTKPLVDFLKWVTDQDKMNSKNYVTFLADLTRVKFELDDDSPFEDFDFLPIGIDNNSGNDLFDAVYDELLIISPFLSDNIIQKATKHSRSKLKLFSREIELQKIKADTIKQIEAWHLVNDYVNGESKFETESSADINYQKQDIHAKLYAYKLGGDAYIVIGSANLTNRALYYNIEFMINLIGKHKKIGTSVIFNDLVNDEISIFKRFASSETGVRPEIQAILEIEEIIRCLKVNFTNTNIKAIAEKKEEGIFSVAIKIDCSKISWTTDYTISAYLFNPKKNQEQVLQAKAVNELNIKNSSETDLSSFLILRIAHKKMKIEIEFAMKIDIKNLPTSRNTKIFKEVIGNSTNFFKYLRFLLADNYWDENFGDEKGFKYKFGSNGDNFDLEQPLYEQMLKAISREPKKLQEIKEVMERIQEEDTLESPIIPENFKQLWSVFETVLPKQLKKIKA